MPATSTSSRDGDSRGITLLEVLISCGLLIVGLSTIAALLPAAGSRLTQATTEDRAAVLLANATAELFARGLVAADTFPAPGTTGTARTLAIGKVLGRLPTFGDLPSGRSAADYFIGPSEDGRRRCGSARTFILEDVLVYDPPRYSDTPLNAFHTDEAGPGPRKVREGICWGATLTPDSHPPAAGGRALVSIAVFKRESENEAGQLEEGIPVVLTRTGSFYEADLVSARSLFRGCSWLLAIPPDPSKSPSWFRIVSSWVWDTPSGRKTRLILRQQESFATLTGSASPGATATVFVFEGIVRVDEQIVTLN
jgi:hypothetical protein